MLGALDAQLAILLAFIEQIANGEAGALAFDGHIGGAGILLYEASLGPQPHEQSFRDLVTDINTRAEANRLYFIRRSITYPHVALGLNRLGIDTIVSIPREGHIWTRAYKEAIGAQHAHFVLQVHRQFQCLHHIPFVALRQRCLVAIGDVEQPRLEEKIVGQRPIGNAPNAEAGKRLCVFYLTGYLDCEVGEMIAGLCAAATLGMNGRNNKEGNEEVA